MAKHIAAHAPERETERQQPSRQARMVGGSEKPYTEQRRAEHAKEQARSYQGHVQNIRNGAGGRGRDEYDRDCGQA